MSEIDSREQEAQTPPHHKHMTPRQWARIVFDTPTKLGYSAMAGLVFVVFALFTVWSINSQAAASAQRLKRDNAIRSYGSSLELYRGQIDVYVACVRTSHGRDDLRTAVFAIDDTLTNITDRLNAVEIGELIRANKADFDAKYQPLSLANCKLPTQPLRPDDVPGDVQFIVPTVPEDIG